MTITLSELSEIDLPLYPNSLVEDGDASYFLELDRREGSDWACWRRPAAERSSRSPATPATVGRRRCWFAR